MLLHAGNLGFYGAWDTLLEAGRKLADEGIGLVFVGDGVERARLEAAAAGVKNIRFLDFFPASKIPSVLAAPDVHLISIKDGLEGVIVPSKLYGILAAGKPVLAVAPLSTDAVTLGHRQGFSVSASPDSPAELVSAVRRLSRDAGEIQKMSRAALAAAPDYDRVNELKKFVQIIEEAVRA